MLNRSYENITNETIVNLNNNHDKCDMFMVKIKDQEELFVAIIPYSSDVYISAITHEISLKKMYDKINNHGFMIQGSFCVEYITNFITLNERFVSNSDVSYFIIDDHKHMNILNFEEMTAYTPYGVNVQYIEGIRLRDNNKLLYPKKDDEKNGGNFLNKNKFNHLIFALDVNKNGFIIYHPDINFKKINVILNKYGCTDAILISSIGETNIMWKSSIINNTNKRDNYIGNINNSASNMLIFSV